MGSVALHGNNSDSDAAETAAYIDSDWKHGIPRFVNYGRQGRLTLRSVKLFADGTHPPHYVFQRYNQLVH